ncbi:MAG: phenylalanine--tRNA ligase subunit beta, partial [Betaproteobacteria bacterium]|nr:phenylalanine--tRNA ligase subunit beta [Betaproteobacteria bacterium]
LEVESLEPLAPAFSQVVVGKIQAIEQHPQADRLRLCQVDVGAAQPLQIVCGAPNAAAGLTVPCALPGATLPGGLHIKPVVMRGVQSAGMLCSAKELGLSQDHQGLMLLDDALQPGDDVRLALGLDDKQFVLKLTPNRPDCLGLYGIAREVAALSGAALVPQAKHAVEVSIDDHLPVRVEAADLCGRFCGRVIRGVDAKAQTPAWMKQRLEHAGQRSISALVDISNYVMLELSRPTHVFDLDRIQGSLTVRWARRGEKLKLLNGSTIELDETVGVIADALAIESLAGIMGGDATAVSDDTRNIYVEAAFWWPQAVAGRARRYNFSTDAAHRFERGVDAHSTADELDYLCSLILQICGGKAGPLDDQQLALPERNPVRLRLARARKVAGIELTEQDLSDAFSRLDMRFRWLDDATGPVIEVQPPSYRFDLSIEEDLIEEVLRLWGFDRLPQRPPKAQAIMRAAPETKRSLLQIKSQIAARGYQEVINYSFVSSELDQRISGEQGIALLNPIASQLDRMRTAVMTGLIESLRFNLNRKADRVRIFECGRVFQKSPQATEDLLEVAGIRQPIHVALLAYGARHAEHWSDSKRLVDFFDLKGDLSCLVSEAWLTFRHAQDSEHLPPCLHPTQSALIACKGHVAGWIGMMHPGLQQTLELAHAPVLAEIALWALSERAMPEPIAPSRFPPVVRDLAFVIDHRMPSSSLREQLEQVGGTRLIDVSVFDEYRGKGLKENEKSLAFRLRFQDTERTLEELEVQAMLEQMIEALQSRCDARLRS